MLVTKRSKLRQVCHTKDLVVFCEPEEFLADDGPNSATNALINFVGVIAALRYFKFGAFDDRRTDARP